MGMIGLIKVSFVLALFGACQSNAVQTKTNLDSAKDSLIIDLEQREIVSLPAELDEISGHVFLPGNDNIVYCVQDERGVIYAYDLSKKLIIDSIPFARKGDFEGITTDGRFFYVLKSNGNIYSVPVDSNIGQESKIFKDIAGNNEYESIGIDTARLQLAILCKECKEDKKNGGSTGYLLTYTETGEVSKDKSFVVDWTELTALSDKSFKSFKPSAISKDPISGNWYILSSIDKVLVVADSNFTPELVIPFSRRDYEQPEGLAFDSQGKLYISSEIGSTDAAKLYRIK